MGISVIGGGTGGGTLGGSGFSLLVGSSGNTTYVFSTPQPAGSYSFTSELADDTFDIYLISPTNTNVGYANATSALEATAEFDRVVVYGATTNDVINFEYKPSASPATSGDIIDGAAPFLTSATPASLPEIDDSTTVTGGNFATDVEIVFTGQDAVDRPAKNIVRSSSTSLIVTRPDVFPVEQEPFTMTATNAGITNPSTNVNKLTDYFQTPVIEYLVVAGGASGGAGYQGGTTIGGGGGGAGGYRNTTGTSGQNSTAESPIAVSISTNYTVTVGAGGASLGTIGRGVNGSPSTFATVTSLGGGGGGGDGNSAGISGGSGGGGTYEGSVTNPGGAGTAGQGFAGGQGSSTAGAGSGGGGAGGVGGLNSGNTGGASGVGLSSSITGTSVTRAVGGKGGDYASGAGASGTVNRGNGGNGGSSSGGAGGSGVVILRYPATFTITIGAGLTGSTATVGANRVTTFTAGTGTVSWA